MNMRERLHEGIRRRECVIRIFPNDRSAIRIVGARPAETVDDRGTDRHSEVAKSSLHHDIIVKSKFTAKSGLHFGDVRASAFCADYRTPPAVP